MFGIGIAANMAQNGILEPGRCENKLYLVFWYIRNTCLLEIRPSVLLSGKLQYLSWAPTLVFDLNVI